MPTYTVTAPDGRKLRLTGDSPPTESDLDEIFSQRPQQTNIQDALKPLEASPEALSIASQNAFGETPQTLTGQQPENFAQFPKEIGQASVEPFVPIPRAEPGGIGANIGMALSPIAAATSMFNPEAGRKMGAGIANIGGDILGGIESPVGLATLGTYGAMSPLVKGIGSLIFGGLMAPGAGQKAGVASVTHDPQDIVEALGAGGMMAAPALHAISTGAGVGLPLTAGDQLRLLAREAETGPLNFPTQTGPSAPGFAPARNVRLGITGVNPNPLADLPPELVTQALAETQRPDLIGGPISAADRIRGLRTLVPEEIPSQRVLKPERLGGQVSFNAPAEAGAVPSAGQVAPAGIRPFFDRPGEVSMMGGESLPPNLEQIRAQRALEERKANAPQTGTEPISGQPEHQGTALGENVRPNEPEVRGQESKFPEYSDSFNESRTQQEKALERFRSGPPLRGPGGVRQKAVFSVADNPKIFDSVVGNIPVDVMDVLAGKKFSADELFHNPAMLKDALSINPNSNVALRVIDALKSAIASTRTKLLESYARGADENVNATLKASDLSPAEVGRLLAFDGGKAIDISGIPELGSAGSGTKLGSIGSVGPNGKFSIADPASLFDWHKKIVKQKAINRNRPNEGGPVEPKQIAHDLGMRFEKETMGNWLFTAFDKEGNPSATFLTKAGATPREISSKYEQVRAEYGDNPTAPRPLKGAPPAVESVTQFVSDFESGKRVTTQDAVKTGLGAQSISDLDALLSSRRKLIASTESSADFTKRLEAETDPAKQQAMITERFTKGFAKNPQYPREAIETATNTGSHVEGEGKGALETKYGPRPLDWREYPEVREWLLDHGEEIWPKGSKENALTYAQPENPSLKSFKERMVEFEKGEGAQTRALKGALKTVSPQELRQAVETAPAEPKLESVTPLEPASGIPLSATDALINKLEALKLTNEFKPGQTRLGTFGYLPHPQEVIALGKAAWNGAVQTAINSIKAGRAVAEAIGDAIDYLKYNSKGFDPKRAAKIRANLNAAIEREAPKSSAPPVIKPGTVPPPPPRRAGGTPPPPRPPIAGGPSPSAGGVPPRIEGTETAMRKSAARATQSPDVPPVVQQRIATAPESFYKRQPMQSVEDVVNGMTDAQLDEVPETSNFYVAARLKKAINMFRDGQMDAGYQVFKDVSQTGTDWGQNINQFKFLKGANPLDIVHIINKELESAGKDPLTPPQMKRVGDASQKSIDANKILEDAKKKWMGDPSDANAQAAQKAMDAAHQKELELQREIAKFKVQNWPRMLKAFAQGNPLTPISQVSNFFGNTLGATMEAGSRSIGSFYDALLSAFTSGRRTLKVQPIAGTVEAAKGYVRGLKEAPGIMKSGAGEVVKGETRQGLQPLRAFTKAFAAKPEGVTVGGKVPFNERVRLAVEGTFGIAPETMLRMLAAADRPAYESARARLIAEQLNLHNVPKDKWAFAQRFPELFFTPDIIKQIKDESSHAVFQSRSKTVSFVEKLIKEKTGDWGDLAFTVMVAPYKLTPWNLVGRTLNYNPLIALAKVGIDAAKGNRRGAVLNAGRMTVGMMLYGAGYFLYKNGLIGPSLDSHDESQKNRLLSGEVLPPNHVNLSGLNRLRQGGDPKFRKGDETWDLTRGGGAAGAILASVANIGRDYEKKPEATPGGLVPQLLAGSAFEQANFTINQSFLKGVTGALDAVQNRNIDPYMNGVENMIMNVPTPNSLTTLSRATRKYMPDLKGDTMAKGFENVVRNRFGFAGLDDYLPIKRDLWGKPMLQTPEGRNAILYQFFDISKNKQVTDDPVSLELYDLWRKTAANEVVPSIPARKIVSGNETFPLTAKQYERYAELVGKNRRQIVQEMVLNPAWQNEDDEQKVKLLENAYTKGLNNGRAIFIGETPPNQLKARPPKAGFK